uniref:Uncharacterized protein n=1 Tax=Panagrellus redivivus TaxID=6233 RepID=A0A7E4W7W5_PANRE
MSSARGNSNVSEAMTRIPAVMPKTPELLSRNRNPSMIAPSVLEEANKSRRSVHFNEDIDVREISIPSISSISTSAAINASSFESFGNGPIPFPPAQESQSRLDLPSLSELQNTNQNQQQGFDSGNALPEQSSEQINNQQSTKQPFQTLFAQNESSKIAMEDFINQVVANAEAEKKQYREKMQQMESTIHNLQMDRDRENLGRLNAETNVENLKDELFLMGEELQDTKEQFYQFRNFASKHGVKDDDFVKSEEAEVNETSVNKEVENNEKDRYIDELLNEIHHLRDSISEYERTQLETSVIFPAPLSASKNISEAIEATLGPIRADYQAKCDQFIVEKVQLQTQLNEAVDRYRRMKEVLTQIRSQRNELRNKLKSGLRTGIQANGNGDAKPCKDGDYIDAGAQSCNCDAFRKLREIEIRSLIINHMINGRIGETIGLNVALIEEQVRSRLR